MRARFTRRHRQTSPLTRLILEARAAAAQIEQPAARELAAREAKSIPVTRVELRASLKGKVAKHVRGLMERLPTMADPAERQDVATLLREMADVLASPGFEDSGVVSRPGRTERAGVTA